MVQRITIAPSQLSTDATQITLHSDQSHYLRHVLRLKVGDRFIAQDGQGHQWLAALAERSLTALVLETIKANPSASATLRLIAALPKGNSFDAVIRQTTELGVTHIHPVIAQRTLLKPSTSKIARWKRIAQEASEQSERITVPAIADPTSFQNCLKSLASSEAQLYDDPSERSLCFICAARPYHNKAETQSTQDNSLTDSLASSPLATVSDQHLLSRLLFHRHHSESSVGLLSVVIAVGPEGGWTNDEITVATSYGYEVVSLGAVILRAVTAPITALSLVTAAREALI